MSQQHDRERFQQLQQQMHNAHHGHGNPIYLKTSARNFAMVRLDVDEQQPLQSYPTKDMHGQAKDVSFLQALGGRGQDGFAGFVGEPGNPQHQHLVKVDDPATCVLEGSARFAQDLLPHRNQKAVNFAEAGILQKGNESDVISVQPRVAPSKLDNEVVPWDKVVYGRKRNPKSWVSDEIKHHKIIKQNLDNLSDQAHSDLAAALYVSGIVGDESLHVGQFMAEVDKNTGKVEGITRIDFGARERHGIARYKSDDYGNTTSKQYKHSGQIGKDYINYYLSHPETQQKYLSMCARQVDETALAKKHITTLNQELDKLPDQQQHQALDDIVETLVKKASKSDKNNFRKIKDMPLDEKREQVSQILQAITEKRVRLMKNKARVKLRKQIDNELDKTNINLQNPQKQAIQELIKTTDEHTADHLHTVNSLIKDELSQDHGKVSKQTRKNAKHLQKAAEVILERQMVDLNDPSMPREQRLKIKQEMIELKQNSIRMQMMNELADYKSHLNSKHGSSAKEKRTEVKLAMKKLSETEVVIGNDGSTKTQFRYTPEQVFNDHFKQTVSKRRHGKNKTEKSQGAKMCDYLDRLTQDDKAYADSKQKVDAKVDVINHQQQQAQNEKVYDNQQKRDIV